MNANRRRRRRHCPHHAQMRGPRPKPRLPAAVDSCREPCAARLLGNAPRDRSHVFSVAQLVWLDGAIRFSIPSIPSNDSLHHPPLYSHRLGNKAFSGWGPVSHSLTSNSDFPQETRLGLCLCDFLEREVGKRGWAVLQRAACSPRHRAISTGSTHRRVESQG
jgi:hypothetical protein